MSVRCANLVWEIEYKHGYKTDHSMLCMDMLTSDQMRGPGFWKLNSKLFHDETYVNKCNEIIEEFESKESTPDVIWELCKNELILWSKKRSTEVAKNKKEKYEKLLQKLNELEHDTTESKCIKNASKIQYYRGLIERHIEEITKSSAFRSKSQYLRDNEKSTKFFLNLEKAKYNKKTMFMIQTEKGLVQNPQEILDAQRSFYSKLYTSDKWIRFNFENQTNIKITDDQKYEMDSEITEQEFTQAVRSL